MKREMIHSQQGYEIPIIHNIEGGERAVVLISHGFGSSKESPTVKIMKEALKKRNMGFLAFDFPAHGESPVDGEKFTIENCLSDLASAEKEIIKKAPGKDIYYFSSSFGAYMNLLYLSLRPHKGQKSFLRCPAVDMPGVLQGAMTPKIKRDFEEKGYTVAKEGFFRPLKLTKTFYDQLQAHDAFQVYESDKSGKLSNRNGQRVMIVHGTEDESASPDKTREFGEKFNIPILWIEGADHVFSGKGMMNQVAEAALTFYCE